MPKHKCRQKKALTCGFVVRLDKTVMISRLARLRGSALRRRSLARGLLIAISLSVALPTNLQSATKEEKPAYDVMNVKLYLHNKINNWQEFECANQLGIRESNWRVNAINKESGAYGIFQHMSHHAYKWDAYTQIDKHIEYIDARYDGSWCKALAHLENDGWH